MPIHVEARGGRQVSDILLCHSQPTSFQSGSLTKPGTKIVDIKPQESAYPPPLDSTGVSDTYMVILRLLCGWTI